jgi:hypothetical protein
LAQELGPDQPVYGLQHVDAGGRLVPFESVEAAAAEFVKHIQGTRPSGSYNILACCAGGPIGYEIAQRLQAKGETTRLAMLDTWPPPLMDSLQGSPQAMANGRVLARYAPSSWEGPLLLLLTSGQTFPGQDPRLYWANLAANCSVVRLSCNDVDDVFRNVSVLAAQLRPYFGADAVTCSVSNLPTTEA